MLNLHLQHFKHGTRVDIQSCMSRRIIPTKHKQKLLNALCNAPEKCNNIHDQWTRDWDCVVVFIWIE